MRTFLIGSITACVIGVSGASAQGLREGVLAVERSQDPPWSYVFAFVECNGGLMLDFRPDRKLNKFRRKTADGGYFIKYNKNKYQMTFYGDGRAKKRDGTIIKWRYPSASELASEGIPADALAQAKAKCR